MESHMHHADSISLNEHLINIGMRPRYKESKTSNHIHIEQQTHLRVHPINEHIIASLD